MASTVAALRLVSLGLMAVQEVCLRPPTAGRYASAPARFACATPTVFRRSALRARARILIVDSAALKFSTGPKAGKRVNLDGMRKEADRVLARAYKKQAKAEVRVAKCEERKDELLAQDEPCLDALAALPNCDELADLARAETQRISDLETLTGLLAIVDGPSHPDAPEALALAERLGVNDELPARPPPSPRKKKGPPPNKGPRLPYRTFISQDGAQVRVGRTASDNDELSCKPEHRDGNDWWMHAAGCPGSHVVIRADSLPGGELTQEVEMDAAILAAKFSKANLGGVVGVSLCKARQVKKPAGAKPGLVQLSGSVRTVRVDWRKEKHRLERLEATLNR
mmetsp:Transcript_22209/g.59930  ORF Transcript_22209/g.59930 Transcript_22209/m.59930 type:complete len:340 (+) Transcript_22209:87-1106(+)